MKSDKIEFIKKVLKESGLDTGRRTLGGSHLDRDQKVFNIDTVQDVITALDTKINAPVKKARYSTLGGERNVSVMFVLSLDSKDTWSNGILENSRYMQFRIEQDGVIEQFTKNYTIPLKFRKAKAKNIDDVVNKINAYLSKIGE